MTFRNLLVLGATCSILAALPAGASTDKSAFATADENPTKVMKAGECEVKCVDPHACCKESEEVIEVLHKLVSAFSQGDIKTYEEYLDDKCAMFDEKTKQLISGKSAVLDHLKNSFAEHAPSGKSPLNSLTIDQPFAKVTNDTCVVTFFATMVIGGAHPHTEKAHITDVFVKRGDKWKKLHWSGHWQPAEGS